MGTKRFELQVLRDTLRDIDPEVVFILLHGSAKGGEIRESADLDIAVYTRAKPSLELIDDITQRIERVIPGVTLDIGFLRGAEPVYRFEALKGEWVLSRDNEAFLEFFLRTAREYESQMVSYERQRRYRLEARNET